MNIEDKLEVIASVWRNYIWEYKLCNNQVKFSEEVQSNYLGIILGYFTDTFDIIFTKKNTETYSERFSYNISLLQAIYVHQDFVEEMLQVFKCNKTKGDLKQDDNYSLNRDIRNELIGHPVRRLEGKLISSTSFSYERDPSKLIYLRYHKENGFRFEATEYNIDDIIERHRQFLNTYFDLIITKLKSILRNFKKELDSLGKIIDTQSFETTISFAELAFEPFFKNTYGFTKALILDAYDRRDNHRRYSNLIDKFTSDLKLALQESSEYITHVIGDGIEKVMDTDHDYGEPIYDPSAEDFHYELGKLATRRNFNDFNFFSSPLRRHFNNDPNIISELDHMWENMDNDMEYYSSFYLLERLISESNFV